MLSVFIVAFGEALGAVTRYLTYLWIKSQAIPYTPFQEEPSSSMPPVALPLAASGSSSKDKFLVINTFS